MVKKIIEHASNLLKNQSKETTIKYILITFIVVISILCISYYIKKSKLNSVNCSNIEKIYTDFPKISSVNIDNQKCPYKLRDYYVKTAYNCCCSGQFKNDWVNVCALKNCIKQGARCLDFEIYSYDNKPVIATSSQDSYNTKETYNYVDFDSALETIANYAFTGSTCPNPNDPLILHFRIQSKNTKIYSSMADSIYKNLEEYLLDKVYSYQYGGLNFGAVPLSYLMKKVVIMIDRSNPLYETTPLAEYVNLSSNSVFMRATRYYDVKYTNDMDELIYYNKKCMTLVMPDLSAYNTNISASLAMKYGCQFVGMNFQNFDSNMEYYSLYFDKEGSAFALKPKTLRYEPTIIKTPTKQNSAVSYAKREVSSDYYNFNI